MNYDFEEATRLINEIQDIIENRAYGCRNDRARSAIQERVLKLKHMGFTEGYTAEKIGQVEVWTTILYSPGKWKKWGPAERVRDSAYGAAHKLMSAVETIERGIDSKRS